MHLRHLFFSPVISISIVSKGKLINVMLRASLWKGWNEIAQSTAQAEVSDSLDVSFCQMPQCQAQSHLSSLNFIICSFPVFQSHFARTFVHR